MAARTDERNKLEPDPQAQQDYMAWGRSAGYVATTIRMAEALDPETTSALQAGKEIELATINKGLNWARVILGTPGGAVLIDRGFDVLQGSDPDHGGGIGDGGIVISNVGHRVKDGGQDGGSGGGGASDDEFAGLGGSGGATETGINDAPINITINNRSANQQAWDSSYSPVLEWAHDNGFMSPVVGESGTLAPSSIEERGGAGDESSTGAGGPGGLSTGTLEVVPGSSVELSLAEHLTAGIFVGFELAGPDQVQAVK